MGLDRYYASGEGPEEVWYVHSIIRIPYTRYSSSVHVY